MKVKEKLEILYLHYFATRGKGHTALLKEGTKNYKGQKFILAHNLKFQQELECKHNEIVSWNSLDKLRGAGLPLAIDNAAMIEILTDSINEICRLEEENKKLRREILELQNKKSIFVRLYNYIYKCRK